MKRLLSVVVPFTLLSCTTTTTGPVPAGEGTFLVSLQEGVLPWDRKPLLPEAVTAASKHCAGLGKTMKLVSTNETPSPVAKAAVVFSCE